MVQNLLPVDAVIKKVGGEVFDCWVDYESKNYPPDPDGYNYDYENGMWRIEVSPVANRFTDHFLNVMTVMDVNTNSKPEVILIENDQLIGSKVLDRMVCFNKSIGELTGSISLMVPGSEDVKVLICDLEPGAWAIIENNSNISTETATDHGMCIYFTVPPGDYRLSRITNSIATGDHARTINALLQNYPNPFNSLTRINFTLENKSDVILEIYDIKGRKVQTLLSRTLEKGEHVVYWEGTNRTNAVVSSGMYLCKLLFGDHVFTKKILLIR